MIFSFFLLSNELDELDPPFGIFSGKSPGLKISPYTVGTNLKLAEGYICHRVPSGPWSGRMKLWGPEHTRSPLAGAERGQRQVHASCERRNYALGGNYELSVLPGFRCATIVEASPL